MRVAIIEDQDENSAVLQAYLERYEAEHSILIRYSHFKDGMEFVADYHPVWDLILLDIEMPLLNGMDTARQIRKADPDVLIIFITALTQYAIEGYSVRALDYVLKPVQYYAFAAKLDQVCEILASRQRRPILISSREGQFKFLPEQIFYVEVQDHTLCYHTKQQLLHTTGTQSLGKLAQELTDSGFARCHQAYLVNLHYVTGYDRSSVFLGEQALPMSRSYYKNFVQMLVEHCAGEGNL